MANPLKILTVLTASQAAKFEQGLSVNSQKVTNLADGTETTDAVAYGQLTGLSSSMKSYVDAGDTLLQGNLDSVSGAIVAYVDAENAAQDAATTALSSALLTYVDAENAAQDAAASAFSGAIKSYVDAADTLLQSNLDSVSGAIVSYVDAENAAQDAATTALSSALVAYIDSENAAQDGVATAFSGAIKAYVDAENAAQDAATDALSSSLVSYIDAENSAQDAAVDALSGALVSYIDAGDAALQGNLDFVSGALKSYVDAENIAQDLAVDNLSGALVTYIDAGDAAEAAARVAEDLTFLKLDGSRAMSGALDMGGQDVLNAKSGSFSGDVTVGGNLQVNGSLTYVNSVNLEVTDKLVTIAKGAADGASADGAGIEVDGAEVSFTYNDAQDKWVSSIGLGVTGEASFDAAMKLSGSAFTNIATPVASGKFDVSDAIHALDLALGSQALDLSNKYDDLRCVVTGTLTSGQVIVNLTTEGGAQFGVAEISNIALDVMVDADNTGYTNDLVAIKMYVDGAALKVQIDAPATPSAAFRLIAVNEADGGLA